MPVGMRPVALAAGLGLCAWALMFGGMFLPCGSPKTATPTITRWT